MRILFYLPVVTPWWFEHIIEPATVSSPGTPAFALNAAEAAHCDLGAVQDGNVVLLFSNSSTTDEIVRIRPLLKARACVLIGVVGQPDSPFGRAVEILNPAGLLGRQSMPVRTVMWAGEDLPTVLPDAPVADLLAVMSGLRMGAAYVIDPAGVLLGLVVDGDVRRHFQPRQDVYDTPAAALMQTNPQVIDPGATLGDAMQMLCGGVLVLPVVDAEGRLHGMLHSKDMLNA